MGRLLQFRCTKCKKLLFKYEIGKSHFNFSLDNLVYMKNVDGNKMFVECPKCKTLSFIEKEGLKNYDSQQIKDKEL